MMSFPASNSSITSDKTMEDKEEEVEEMHKSSQVLNVGNEMFPSLTIKTE